MKKTSKAKASGDLPETTVFKSYAAKDEPKSQYANLPAYPQSAFLGVVNDIQPFPKRCLLMLLTRVGARADSTTHAATTRGVANFHARVLVYVQYAPRVLHFSAFHFIKFPS